MKKLLLIIWLMATTWNIMATGIGKETSTMTTGNKSNCTYIDKPDILLERVINKVKKEKRTNDIFCDRDGMRMAYYLIEGEEYNLTLGVAISVDLTTTNAQFKNGFRRKLDEYKGFFKNLDKRNMGKTPLPDNEVIRFYGQISGSDKFFVIGKYVNDLNAKKEKMIVSNQGKIFFDKINLFEGMVVEYSDEIVF